MGIAKRNPGLEVLRRTISDLEHRIVELKKAANALTEAEGLPPAYPAVGAPMEEREELDASAFRLGEGSGFSSDTQD